VGEIEPERQLGKDTARENALGGLSEKRVRREGERSRMSAGERKRGVEMSDGEKESLGRESWRTVRG